MRPTTTLPLAPPSGMEDLLPAETRARGTLLSALMRLFNRCGYERVITPAVEHAEVLERGLEVDRRDVLRFVDPDTGEVALLRPDITPQIARIVATRLRDRPAPWRLAYHGTVLRQRHGRARRSRQRVQVGVECIGLPDREADVDVIDLAIRACRTAGLDNFRVELGHVQIARAALQQIPEGVRARASEALGRKDHSEFARLDIDDGQRRRLSELANLYGGADVLDDVLDEAERTLSDAAPQLDALRTTCEALRELGHGDVLGVDLGELRGHAYYTGVSFTILAEGPGEPIGGGGRYDDLLARFGHPAPATGFAIDAGNLLWALRESGKPWTAPRPVRLVWVGLRNGEVARLRAAGFEVGTFASPEGALAFARAWGYDGVLASGRLQRTSDGATRDVDQKLDQDAVHAWLRSEVK